MLNLSTVTFDVHSILNQSLCSLSRAQCAEVIAAYLGYESLAALKSEETGDSLDTCFADAEFIILNVESGICRLKTLARENISDVLSDLVTVQIVRSLSVVDDTCKVFKSVDEFYFEYAQEKFCEAIIFSDEWGSATSELNAEFSDYPEMNENYSISGDLWRSREEWSLEAQGSSIGSYAGSDRFYNGHKIDCWGKMKFLKAGRAGLIFSALDANAGTSNEDWRDEDDWVEIG
ncbi:MULTISPECIES: hypothetical protein [Enterobacteriaceae]|uniref:hypothetical protein n=1 Tax=Enterobacteriaceae TaxID=543 RepID=UPI000926E641|nr:MULTISPECIES: hypothetical protein [Enterobacteriaceae]AWI99669.1 hypothetical protein DEF50_08985 [Escherichia coli]EFA4819994.1 hypothetical protein [Escherichia coli]EFB2094791.1 hypothetical protein [Escherichia coli]EFE6879945.1 hypothetical protein [Escherichia coli]EFH2906298.1 hypothetical protein [Escherichia coli]